MTRLNFLVEVRDLSTDTIIATCRDISAQHLSRAVAKVNTLHLEAPGASTLIPQLLAAMGSANRQGPPLPYLLRYSCNNGTSWQSAMLVEDQDWDFLSQSVGLILDGNDIGVGIDYVFSDRLTLPNCTVSDALIGVANQIPVVPTGTRVGLVNTTGTVENAKGFGLNSKGQPSLKGRYWLSLTIVPDEKIANVRVDFSSYVDSIHNCLDTLSSTASAYYDPNDTAPAGSRGKWAYHAGKGLLRFGYMGTSPLFTISDGQVHAIDGITVFPLYTRNFKIARDGSTRFGQVELLGGQTNHGLPDAAVFNDLVQIKNGTDPTTVAWDASLPVGAFSTGNDGGGIFYWPGDNLWHRIGTMTLDCYKVLHHPSDHMLYAATSKGVFTHSDNPLDTSAWVRIASLMVRIEDLWLDGDTILAHAKNNGTGDGLYQHPALAGELSGNGYDGWSIRSGTSSLLCAGGTATCLFTVDSNHASYVNFLLPSADTTDPPPLRTPCTSDIVGVSHGATGTYIFTTDGALGAYFLAHGTTAGPMTDINADGSLVDDNNNPVLVRSVLEYTGPPINGQAVAKLAATDTGPYFTLVASGGGWGPVAPTAGIGDFDAHFLSVGNPQTLMTQVHTVLCAGNTNGEFWMSFSDGEFWRNQHANLVNGLSFMHKLGQEIGLGPYLPKDIGAIGNTDPPPAATTGSAIGSIVPLSTYRRTSRARTVPTSPPLHDTGGSGRLVTLPKSSKFYVQPGLCYCIRKDSEWNDAVRVIDLYTDDFWNKLKPGEIQDLVANDQVAALTADAQLLLTHVRALIEAGRIRTIITTVTSYSVQEASALYDSFGGDMYHLTTSKQLRNLDGTTLTLFDIDMDLWLISYTEQHIGNGVMEVTLTGGTALEPSPPSIQEIADGIIYQSGKAHRRSGGGRRHK